MSSIPYRIVNSRDEAPLTIEFAFNEQERVVIILRFHLWAKKPDRQD